jgi:hypothetical protein
MTDEMNLHSNTFKKLIFKYQFLWHHAANYR